VSGTANRSSRRIADRSLSEFSKKDLDGYDRQAQGDIVMVIVRQPTRKATWAAVYSARPGCERLFDGSNHNVDPAGGSRLIKTPMSQILEPLTSHLGGSG
jgi:hypothetical protein